MENGENAKRDRVFISGRREKPRIANESSSISLLAAIGKLRREMESTRILNRLKSVPNKISLTQTLIYLAQNLGRL
jgi:hypothetical protein